MAQNTIAQEDVLNEEQAPMNTPPKPKKRRRRLGDRPDGRKLRTIPPMLRFMPYIMPKRSDALNYYTDCFEITNIESLWPPILSPFLWPIV